MFVGWPSPRGLHMTFDFTEKKDGGRGAGGVGDFTSGETDEKMTASTSSKVDRKGNDGLCLLGTWTREIRNEGGGCDPGIPFIIARLIPLPKSIIVSLT